jgi:anti-sigma regulatory factor (Ser/Thr protein kinase)/virulence-associated protein VapD
VWREHVAPLLKDVPANVFKICNYGFTEMVNNVIDHSEGSELFFSVMITAVNIELTVSDNGVGIFNKIQKEFQLDDPLHSLLELSKGKLTTDKTRHSGEGIFFTSRMFDFFVIQSGNISFAHMDYGSKSNNPDLGESDFLLEHKSNLLKGTSIKMQINTASEKTPQDVFDRYTLADTFGFTKTIVPVFLSSYGDENLISRSQAKRLLARFEVFKEIVLDFKMVKTIGQAFADEVFRVFQQQNPEIHIYPIRANKQIKTMIGHVTGKDPDSL